MDAAKKIQELYGITLEMPLETTDDLMREAQAVVNWFESRGAGFESETCRWCKLPFEYSWNVKGVKYCSVRCMDHYLQSIGLKWNPSKPPEERWGKTIPAVVPPAALSNLQDLIDTLEAQLDNTSL